MADDLNQTSQPSQPNNQARTPRPMISVEEIEKAVAQARADVTADIAEKTKDPEPTSITQDRSIPETTPVAVSSIKENILNFAKSQEPKVERPPIQEGGITQTTPIAVSSIKESVASINRAQEIQKAAAPQEDVQASIVRTFKTDIAEAVRENNMSLAGVAIKEDEKRREEAGTAVHASRVNKLLVLGSLTLVIAGIAVIGYIAFIHRDKNLPPATTTQAQAIIFTDDTTDIDVTGMSFKELREKIDGEVTGDRLRVGTIKNLRFINTRFVTKEEEEVSERYWLSAQELFQRLSIPARASFIRQLAPEFLYGIYSFKGQDGFLILTTNDYASMFAQLLGYEDTLARDLYPVVTGKDIPDIEGRVWGDEVIDNIDARVIRNQIGDMILLWSFLGTRDTILIAPNEDIFREVVERIQTPKTGGR